jgi:hypothetical protein
VDTGNRGKRGASARGWTTATGLLKWAAGAGWPIGSQPESDKRGAKADCVRCSVWVTPASREVAIDSSWTPACLPMSGIDRSARRKGKKGGDHSPIRGSPSPPAPKSFRSRHLSSASSQKRGPTGAAWRRNGGVPHRRAGRAWGRTPARHSHSAKQNQSPESPRRGLGLAGEVGCE